MNFSLLHIILFHTKPFVDENHMYTHKIMANSEVTQNREWAVKISQPPRTFDGRVGSIRSHLHGKSNQNIDNSCRVYLLLVSLDT